MSFTNRIEEIATDDPLMLAVHGGEVGATGMGDDYHYTGQERWYDCVIAEMTGRGGRQKGPLESMAICTF